MRPSLAGKIWFSSSYTGYHKGGREFTLLCPVPI